MSTNLGIDQEKLAGVIGAVQENPEMGKTTWKARAQWKEGFQSEAIIDRQGGCHTVPMDEPKGMGGTDTAPNMVEMVLGAYGCCLTTGFVANAALAGIALEGVDIELEGDLDLRGFFGLASDVPAGYSEVRVNISLNAPTAAPAQLQGLYDAVMRTSPVGDIITRPVPIKAQLV